VVHGSGGGGAESFVLGRDAGLGFVPGELVHGRAAAAREQQQQRRREAEQAASS
jgi:hypothetical protein